MNRLRVSSLAFSVATALCVLAMAFGVLFAPEAAAIVVKSGPITADETWGGDTYVLAGNVTVRPGVTLTIRPGTPVRFNAGVYLFVEGRLVADGVAGNRIAFAPTTLGPVGIQFNASATGSVSWSSFIGFNRPVTAIDSSPSVTNNTIAQAGVGLGFAGSSSLVADNAVDNASVGIQVGDANVQILRNTVNHTSIGIQLLSSGTPRVADNTITNVSGAVAIGIYMQGPLADLENNVVRRVTGLTGLSGPSPSDPGGTGGIAIGILVNSSADARIVGNTITDVKGGHGGRGAAGSMGPNPSGFGGTGGPAVGIAVGRIPTVRMEWNVITNLKGGDGGEGGGGGGSNMGGRGGDGGDAAGIQTYDALLNASWEWNAVDGIQGGKGGDGGGGTMIDGRGGTGGDAMGFFSSNAMDGFAANNVAQNLRGGRGGNCTLLGGGNTAGGAGGNAMALGSMDMAGVHTFAQNLIMGAAGGDGGIGARGGPGGNATAIFTLGSPARTFNLTFITGNWVADLAGGEGGIGASGGGGDGGAAGAFAAVLVSPQFAGNSVRNVWGGAGGDAVGGIGGRGGDAVGFASSSVSFGRSAVDQVDTVTAGVSGTPPPPQPPRGIGYYLEGDNLFRAWMAIENATIMNIGYQDLLIERDADAFAINTFFDPMKVGVGPTATLVVCNFLGVEAYWPDFTTLVSGVSILVEEDGVPVWDVVSATGAEQWLSTVDRVYLGSPVPTDVENRVTVSYPPYAFQNNPRIVDMAWTHSEAFFMIDGEAPTSTAGPLPTYTNTATFSIPYVASDGNGTGLSEITLWYRWDGGAWTSGITQPASTSGQFDFTASGDGTYEFVTVATDLAGNAEPDPSAGPAVNETWTIVDTTLPASSINALPVWTTTASFLVSWGPDPGTTDVDWYRIDYRHDGGAWTTWLGDTTATSATFTASPPSGLYEFRSMAMDRAGNFEPAPLLNDSWTRVDIDPPESAVSTLPAYETSLTFSVSWGPSGGTTDIASYRIDVEVDGGGWTTWITSTTQTSADYTGVDGSTYAFRSVATDFAGNTEVLPTTNDTWTRVDVTPPESAVDALQPYQTTLAFALAWGPDAGTTDIATYTIEYSDDGGAWTDVPGAVGTTVTSVTFSLGTDGHRIAFRSVATDRAGNVEVAPLTNDTWTTVDVTRPTVTSSSPRGANVNTTPLIVVTFSEPMNRSSVESASSITPDVDGTFSWSADGRTITFHPSRALAAGVTYTVLIDSSTRDLAGNTMAQAASFQFTTTATAGPGVFDFLWIAGLFVAALTAVFLVVAWRMRTKPKPAPAAETKPKQEGTIDDVFLLYSDGILVKHETRRLKPDMDTDILSGMLTAVQHFVRDSFRADEALDEMTFGEMHILIGRGKWLILAGIITGEGSASMSQQLKKCIADMEEHHADGLKEWDGDMELAKTLSPYVRKLIRGDYA